MLKLLFKILLIIAGLFYLTGWACYSDNQYIIEAREAFNLEVGCKIRKSY